MSKIVFQKHIFSKPQRSLDYLNTDERDRKMFKREAYLKNIASGLSQLQVEVKLNNKADLYDINRTAEDFFCGLLNLIYGYDLKNENNEVRNAVAIDLYDSKNRISIQVTSDNTSEKIQSTINKFIDYEKYQNYDQLYILLLKDRLNYRKGFDTKGKINFDKEHNILTVGSLMEKVKGLDTETLEKIDDYLAKELSDNYRENKAQRHRRCGRIILGIAIIGVLLITGVTVILKKEEPSAKVEFSEVLSYQLAGSYEEYKDLPPVEKTKIEVKKAFSILSFVRNSGEEVSAVEKIYCDILSLEPIEEPKIIVDAHIVDNTLKIFAFNNGWTDNEALTIKSAVLYNYMDSSEIGLDNIAQEKIFAENSGVASGEAVFLGEYVLDGKKFLSYYKEYASFGSSIEVQIEVEGEQDSHDWSAFLRYENGEFRLEYGGGDSGDIPSITLFAVLDVDSKPSAIVFTGENATALVNDVLRIETVLAPTKSCIVECRNVFYINGKKRVTDTFTAAVEVPVLTNGAIGLSGPLTRELAQLQNPDRLQMEQLVKKYLYDPESVKDENKITDGQDIGENID